MLKAQTGVARGPTHATVILNWFEELRRATAILDAGCTNSPVTSFSFSSRKNVPCGRIVSGSTPAATSVSPCEREQWPSFDKARAMLTFPGDPGECLTGLFIEHEYW